MSQLTVYEDAIIGEPGASRRHVVLQSRRQIHG